MNMKIVINTDYGGFGLSTKAFKRLIELGMTTTVFEGGELKDKKADIIIHKGGVYYSFVGGQDSGMRTNHLVIQVVEELKDEANGPRAELEIIEIPNDIQYTIEEYDGLESVHEEHGSWP